MALVGCVTIAILLFGDKTSRFTRFDFGCLGAVAAILVFWGFTRQHAAAHLAIQAILVIAYFPVVKRIWQAERNTESFAAWIGMLLAAALSLLSSEGRLATVYSVRAVACTSLLLLLMIRAKRREGRVPDVTPSDRDTTPTPAS
jgi:drug/metabolite transporter superfamily protein YnfA